jgi:predicted RNA binding protein YcfA (HicA-like mRNA interferase family)
VSGRLPVVSGAATVEALAKAGFAQVSQRGSHVKLRGEGGRTVIVPMHRELASGTLRSVLRQAGLSADEFSRLLTRRGRRSRG